MAAVLWLLNHLVGRVVPDQGLQIRAPVAVSPLARNVRAVPILRSHNVPPVYLQDADPANASRGTAFPAEE